MKLRSALAALGVAVLAGCGAGKPKGIVQFIGLTPNTALQKTKDKRDFRTFCPACHDPIEFGASQCPDVKVCKTRNIDWEGSYPCAYCNGEKTCTACRLLEQEGGKCLDCRGAGYLTFLGKTPTCPNCKGNGKCPICDGKNLCDYCKGEGKIAFDDLKSRVKKTGEGEGDAAATPGNKPEAPKTEEKK